MGPSLFNLLLVNADDDGDTEEDDELLLLILAATSLASPMMVTIGRCNLAPDARTSTTLNSFPTSLATHLR